MGNPCIRKTLTIEQALMQIFNKIFAAGSLHKAHTIVDNIKYDLLHACLIAFP